MENNMALVKSPVDELGKKAPEFRLLGIDGQYYSLADCKGENGLLVMFICNHCPYVKAVLPRLLEDVKVLQKLGIGCVAICANDPIDYPEDSYENMQKIAKTHHFPFPYLVDTTQEIAKAYEAVCTPDFFGYNTDLILEYRGRLEGTQRELVEAMQLIADTGKGPKDQIPTQGCSIKWSK